MFRKADRELLQLIFSSQIDAYLECSKQLDRLIQSHAALEMKVKEELRLINSHFGSVSGKLDGIIRDGLADEIAGLRESGMRNHVQMMASLKVKRKRGKQ